MEHRVLVMNGQRLLQSVRDGKWVTNKVDKAGRLKPGIYSLQQAKPADRSKRHEGVVLHVDRDRVYQQVGKRIVYHAAQAFKATPQPGESVAIEYRGDVATSALANAEIRRGMRR